VLIERPEDFGSTFLERTLIACLFQGADYVHAQQERSRLANEMQAAMADCDVLVTAGAGPAPKLSPALAKWPNPHRFIPFSVTGNPAVVACSGFSKAGLPVSIQFVGKPFEDANVLGIAHAYEKATEWSQRRAVISPEARPAPIAHSASATSVDAVDPKIVDLCDRAAKNAGLNLPHGSFALLCHQAPNALEIVARIRSAREFAEPAGVFRFPG
jgi:aspartyl-tRNA(Asn)/glutamyl-tRNA(Gln) amidotransferase subunit A